MEYGYNNFTVLGAIEIPMIFEYNLEHYKKNTDSSDSHISLSKNKIHNHKSKKSKRKRR